MQRSQPVFFASPLAFRRWLKTEHQKAGELWVGFYKKSTGKPSITYSEALDEALCFGWIDGVRKSVDADSYRQRFQSQAPWYRRTSTFWVMSAKHEETREKRFSTLLSDCEQGLLVKPLRRVTRAKRNEKKQ